MTRIVALRRTREHVALERAELAELRVIDRLLPLRRMVHDEVADRGQRRRIRVPDAVRGEHAARLQMNVEARGMHVAAHHVRKARGDMRFVRFLVRREAHVTVNAKHRTARRARVSNQLGADLPEPRSEVAYEREHRLTNFAFVARTIRLEPFAPVVGPQFLQEAEQVTAEMRFLHRRQSSSFSSAGVSLRRAVLSFLIAARIAWTKVQDSGWENRWNLTRA